MKPKAANEQDKQELKQFGGCGKGKSGEGREGWGGQIRGDGRRSSAVQSVDDIL